MPGIFAAVGGGEHIHEELRCEFLRPWGTGEYVKLASGILGGHAFTKSSVLHRTREGVCFAVDGEESIYRSAQAFAAGTGPELFRIASGGLTLTPACKGNVIAVEPRSGRWYLATEVMGSFPLYYAATDNGVLFSSRLKPLARILEAELDLIAVREFLHELYTLNGRSFYRNIRHLMPGQILEYDPAKNSTNIQETGAAWAQCTEAGTSDLRHAGKVSWNLLLEAVGRCFSRDFQAGLMISGGWDSRTLLAAMREYLAPAQLQTYLHGDFDSREARIAEKICLSSNVEIAKQPFDADMYNLEILQRGFHRVETVFFPEWHRAGILLKQRGVRSVTAGIYGEVLGGHYGTAMLLNGMKKIAAVGAELAGRSNWIVGESSQTYQAARDRLYVKEISRPWYLASDVLDLLSNAKDVINSDIEATVQRLERRGVSTASQLIEAFITEHRGAQCIMSQLLSCRAYVDIALPFADNDFIMMASRMSFRTKVHNSLNREMLRQFAPDLLDWPCASMLVAAKQPIVIQEASRLIRHLIEKNLWRGHFATRGRLSPPRFSYLDFEFLRNGNALQSIAEDLQSSLWDREAINKRMRSLNECDDLFTLSQLMTKIYNVDLMIR